MTTTIERINEIEKTHKLHHTSMCRGYVGKKAYPNGILEEYEGKFGKGYTLKEYSHKSTNYCWITYYIKED